MPTQVISDLSAEVREYYNLKMLQAARPKVVHMKGATKVTVPRQNGLTINWNRVPLLDVATTPLVESITPTGQAITAERISSTLYQYGSYVKFSDVMDMVSIDKLATVRADRLGESAGRTLDVITRDAIAIGSNVSYAGGRTARNQITQADVITSADVQRLQRDLENRYVEPMDDGYYWAYCSPNTRFDIQRMDEWQKTGQYQAQDQLERGRVVALYNIKFWITPLAKVFTGAGSGGTNVAATIAFGKDAYACVDLEGMGMETMVWNAGQPSDSDPLGQRGSQGWKTMFAAKILNNAFIQRLEHATTN